MAMRFFVFRARVPRERQALEGWQSACSIAVSALCARIGG
jgi:hypothetical protein